MHLCHGLFLLLIHPLIAFRQAMAFPDLMAICQKVWSLYQAKSLHNLAGWGNPQPAFFPVQENVIASRLNGRQMVKLA